MHFLIRIRDIFLDFLFPKHHKVLELEALSVSEILDILPKTEPIEDKYTLALFDYSHPLAKEIIWQIKYSGNTRLADKIGEILYDYIRHELEDLTLFENWSKPIIVPIPISDKRRFERGWNQSEILSEHILKHDHEKFFRYLPRQLVKIHHTESQTKTSSREERLENLADSMKVLNPSLVAGECLVVIDDVTTTGSTFAEARRVLRTAGARKILCIAVAH